MVEQLSALSTIAYDGHRMAQEGFPGTQHTGARYSSEDYGLAADMSHMNTLPNINPALSMNGMFAPQPTTINPFAALSLPSQALPRTAEELAIVNKFLVRLGQTIAAQNTQPPPDSTGGSFARIPSSFPSNIGQSLFNGHQQQQNSLYDASTLAALGVSGGGAHSSWANAGETATMASLGLPPTATQMYGYAAALAGLPRTGANLNIPQSSSLGVGSLYPHGVLPSPGRSSSRSGSPNDVDGTILGQETSVSPLIQPAPSSSSSVASGFSTSNQFKTEDQLSQASSTPVEQPSDPFANVPTTKEVRRGHTDVPKLASIATAPLPIVRQKAVPLQTLADYPARPAIKTEEIDIEEVDELLSDDDQDGDELMASASTAPSPTPTPPPPPFPTSSARSSMEMSPARFPSQTQSLHRPLSSGTMYPRITHSPSPPRERERTVTLPSAASLISRADELANERRRLSQSSISRYPDPTRLNSMAPVRPSSSLRQKHLAALDALTQWVNSEFRRRHGSPRRWAEPEQHEWKSGDSEGEDEDVEEDTGDYESEDDDDDDASPVAFPLRAVGARDVEMVSVA